MQEEPDGSPESQELVKYFRHKIYIFTKTKEPEEKDKQTSVSAKEDDR
jgi:hypothetical protein